VLHQLKALTRFVEELLIHHRLNGGLRRLTNGILALQIFIEILGGDAQNLPIENGKGFVALGLVDGLHIVIKCPLKPIHLAGIEASRTLLEVTDEHLLERPSVLLAEKSGLYR
jgi:hypothetical protein